MEEFFATSPAHERPVVEAVLAHLHSLGPIEIEALSVGIFVKRDGRTVLQLRTMTKWVALAWMADAPVRHPTVKRKPTRVGARWWMVANVATPAEFDDALADAVTEAYGTVER